MWQENNNNNIKHNQLLNIKQFGQKRQLEKNCDSPYSVLQQEGAHFTQIKYHNKIKHYKTFLPHRGQNYFDENCDSFFFLGNKNKQKNWVNGSKTVLSMMASIMALKCYYF